MALAEATSTITLLVFTLINLSLLVLQRREPPPPGAFQPARWIPVVGLLLCLAMLGFSIFVG